MASGKGASAMSRPGPGGGGAMAERFDLVAAIEELCRDLDAAGESERSSALRDALAGSVVPGEILGETREQLRLLRRSAVARRLGLRERIDVAAGRIDAALGGRWRA